MSVEHFYKQIPGWFDFGELYTDAVKRLPERGGIAVEVGNYLGRSLAYLMVEILKSKKHALVVSVDSCVSFPAHLPIPACTMLESRRFAGRNHHDVLWENLRPAIGHPSLVWQHLTMRSTDAAREFAEDGLPLDFVFIDADHSYEAVRDDLRAWWPLVKSGGVLAGHDYNPNWPGVIRAVDEFVKEGAMDYIAHRGKSYWIEKP